MSCNEHQSQLERRRVRAVAREYREQGYDVTMYPDPEALPKALKDCALNLIAQKGEKVLAVEVRSRDNLTLNGSQDLRRIASLVTQVPGWEFELVVTNPRSSRAQAS